MMPTDDDTEIPRGLIEYQDREDAIALREELLIRRIIERDARDAANFRAELERDTSLRDWLRLVHD
jgi:hypothetical protein